MLAALSSNLAAISIDVLVIGSPIIDIAKITAPNNQPRAKSRPSKQNDFKYKFHSKLRPIFA